MHSASLTQRLLDKCRCDPQDALQQVALAVLQQEGIRDDSVLRAERVAALAPPVAAMVLLAEWLAYAEWEGFDSALYAHPDAVAALLANQLQLPDIADNLLRLRDAALFDAQRPALAAAAVRFIERHITLFPV